MHATRQTEYASRFSKLCGVFMHDARTSSLNTSQPSYTLPSFPINFHLRTGVCLLLLLFGPASGNGNEAQPTTAREIKVTNGTPVEAGEYPFLSALLSGREASVILGNRVVSGEYLGAGLIQPFGGPIVDCGLAFDICYGAANRVCSIVFDFTTAESAALSPAQQLSNCREGGGIGAIFRTNGAFAVRRDLGGQPPQIPAVAVSDQASYDALMFALSGGGEAQVEVSAVVPDTILCGATYLGDLWVLTAAHCVIDIDDAGSFRIREPAELLVNVGAYDLRYEQDLAQPVAEVIPANYQLSGPWGENDVALLRLYSPPPRGKGVGLISRQNLDASSAAFDQALILGWGSTGVRAPLTPLPEVQEVSPVPLSALLNLHTTDSCSNEWQRFLKNNNLNTGGLNLRSIHVCASNPEQQQDACQGDSGGPLLVNVEGDWQLAGVTSFGLGCGATNSVPGVYASVPAFAEWIYAHTDSSRAPPTVVQVQFSDAGLQSNSAGSMDWTLLFFLTACLGCRRHRWVTTNKNQLLR